jgi:hypothetical protein
MIDEVRCDQFPRFGPVLFPDTLAESADRLQMVRHGPLLSVYAYNGSNVSTMYFWINGFPVAGSLTTFHFCPAIALIHVLYAWGGCHVCARQFTVTVSDRVAVDGYFQLLHDMALVEERSRHALVPRLELRVGRQGRLEPISMPSLGKHGLTSSNGAWSFSRLYQL